MVQYGTSSSATATLCRCFLLVLEHKWPYNTVPLATAQQTTGKKPKSGTEILQKPWEPTYSSIRPQLVLRVPVRARGRKRGKNTGKQGVHQEETNFFSLPPPSLPPTPSSPRKKPRKITVLCEGKQIWGRFSRSSLIIRNAPPSPPSSSAPPPH